jgi:hypothetical protein
MSFAFHTAFLGEDEWGYMNLARFFDTLKYPAFYEGEPVAIPPLISAIYAIPFVFTGINLAVAKMISALFGVATLYVMYLIGSKLEEKGIKGFNIFGLSAVFLLLSMSYFTNFMMLAYVEVPIAFFSVLFLYYFLFKFKDTRSAIYLGIIMGVAMYMKLSAIFFPIALVIYAVLMYFYKKDKNILKLGIISAIVFALIISPWIIRNLILFHYPFVEGLNLLFKASWTPAWVQQAATTISLPVDIIATFSLISVSIAVISVIYCGLTKDSKMNMIMLMIVVFMGLYYAFFVMGAGISDPRYLSIIFPEVALLGGFFLSKLYQANKYFIVVLLAIFALSFYTSFVVAQQTASTQRYPDTYIRALQNIKSTSLKSDITFTAFGGSVGYYADRSNIWAIPEFPQVMTTNDSSYIYSTLKSYNITYILVWRNIVANNYIVPQSNLIGAFTPSFINTVDADKTDFTLVFSNQDTLVWKIN